ncbi:hypothetical protein [Paenarthrobacter nicotinovorans]|jgi:hypothetical protein|uniref:hypothetical protein n=1 Tax=Paenarthrobacter nicotinovorans TaxID=29320 RepID=UPI003D67595D
MAEKISFEVKTTDGKSYEVATVFADLIKYDILRNRFGYPAREGNEFVFMGLLAMCALSRTKQIDANLSPDAFLETIESIDPIVEDEAEFPANADN